MGKVSRNTRDIDVVDPPLDEELILAATKTAKEFQLQSDWINNQASDMTSDLPEGWRQRTQVVFTGRNITVHVLGRADLLISKIYAYCDRETDLDDILAKPSREELQVAKDWVATLDANPLWAAHVNTAISIIQHHQNPPQMYRGR